MKQINFTEIFFDHFGGKPKKIKYEIRPGANLLHDLAFMNSLIHDARIKPNEITVRGSRIIVPIERDCWEIPRTVDKNELHIATSKITFENAKGPKWEFEKFEEINNKKEIWLDYIYFDENFRSHDLDSFGCLVAGDGWRLRFKINSDSFKVKLQDQETPYLYSEKGAT